MHVRIQSGTWGPDPPLKNHANMGFLSNSGSDSMKNHKATKQAFNVGPTSARQRNAIKMAFRSRAYSGIFDPSSPHQLERKKSNLDPFWQNFLDPRMKCIPYNNNMRFIAWQTSCSHINVHKVIFLFHY